MGGERFGPVDALPRVDFRLGQYSGAPTLMCKVAWVCLWPLYHVLAKLRGCPGLDWQRFAIGRVVRLAIRNRRLLRGRAGQYVACPVDSVRYFEFAALWGNVRELDRGFRYLDISSPRMFPLRVVTQLQPSTAELFNPDGTDLDETRKLFASLHQDGVCRFRTGFLEDAGIAAASFDVISSISVIEHIPDARPALTEMWRVLRPGGTLLLSIPCAARGYDEYLNEDPYGLLAADGNGSYFAYRVFDERALRQQVYCVLGEPAWMRIFGEKKRGFFDDMRSRKRVDPCYPYWREPWHFAGGFGPFTTIEQLPGLGVCAMVFRKPMKP